MPEESNFQHAPPGMRRSGQDRPSATLPEGVAAPGKRRPAAKAAPRAVIPDAYRGPVQPDGGVGMVPVFMLGVGVHELLSVPTGGALVLAVCFTLLGMVGCVAWVEAWLAWRRAWKFEWRLFRWPKGKWWR